MTTPAALIVDFGGVLTTDLWAAVRSCACREGLPENALIDVMHAEPIHSLFLGLEEGSVDQGDFERRLGEAVGVSDEGLLGRMCADLRPDAAMLEAVARYRAGGIRTAVLSNSWGTGYFNPYLGYDLDKRVDTIVISGDVGIRKPDPKIFAMTADLLGVPPSGCVMVDDTASHLTAAKDLGMRVIHHVKTASTLATLADWLSVSSPADLSADAC